MTNEEKIAKLSARTPVARRDRMLTVVRDVCSAIAVIALGLVVAVMVIVFNKSTCTNNALASRNASSNKATTAQKVFYQAVIAALTLPPGETPSQGNAERAKFIQQANRALGLVSDVSTAHKNHPLGNC